MRRAGLWLRGWGTLEITGADTSRFLNRCVRAGLHLEEAQAVDPFTCRVTVRLRDRSRAEKLAVDSGCESHLLALRGLPRARRRLWGRKVLLFGGILAAAALLVSSLFVWDIRVTENDSSLSEGEILRVLEEQGVGVGAFWPGFHGELISSRALAALPELSWLAVNVRGSRARVEVRAAVPVPEIWDPRESVDVIAAHSGVIAELHVLEGTAKASVGDAVTAGQLLIAGETSGGGSLHARGEVTAYTWRELVAQTPRRRLEKLPRRGEKRRFYLLAGDRRIKISPNSGIMPPGYDKMTRTTTLAVENAFTLPLAWETERWRPYALREVSADPAELRRLLERELERALREELGERGTPLALHYSASVTAETVTVTLRAECRERIDLETARASKEKG